MSEIYYEAVGQAVPVRIRTTVGGVPQTLTTPPALWKIVKPDGTAVAAPVSSTVDAVVSGYRYTLPAAETTAWGAGLYELYFRTNDADVDGKATDGYAYFEALASVGVTWITSIADILADTSALIPGTTPARLTPYDPTSLTIDIIYGADYTATSSLGRLEIPNTVTALNIATAGGTLTFAVRLANEKAGSGYVFTAATVTAMDSDTAYVSLVDPTETRAIQPGMAAIWSLMHETAGGLITPLNGGRYTVTDSVPPT